MDKILKLIFIICTTLFYFSSMAKDCIKKISNDKENILCSNNVSDSSLKTKGYNGMIEFSIANGSYSRFNRSIRLINGYKFCNDHFIGVGIGVTTYPTKYNNLLFSKFRFYPIFLRYSFDLIKIRNLPYFFADIGTQIQPAKAKEQGIVFLKIGIGNRFSIKDKKISTTLDYSMNKARFTHNYYSYPEFGYWYRNHMVSLSVGWHFN